METTNALLILSVCTFPLEYCEFGSSLTRCKEWLKEENEDLYDKFYSEGEHLSISSTKDPKHLTTLDRGATSQDWHAESGGTV